jgi:hypothetical protein
MTGQATLQPHQRLRTLLPSSPACRFVAENLYRLIKLLNLQWLLQDRDRTNLKDPIQDFAIRVTCDDNDVKVRINLFGCFIHLITWSIGQLQVQKHEIEFLLLEAFNGLCSLDRRRPLIPLVGLHFSVSRAFCTCKVTADLDRRSEDVGGNQYRLSDPITHFLG